MNFLDLLMLALLFLGGRKGYKRGLSAEMGITASTLLGVLIAYRFAGEWAQTFSINTGMNQTFIYYLFFLLTVIGATALGMVVFPFVAKMIVKSSYGNQVEHIGGSLVGVFKVWFVILIALVCIIQIPWYALHSLVLGSPLALWTLRLAPSVFTSVQTIIR